jgi:Cdc6-like AAA superfamily ATPase
MVTDVVYVNATKTDQRVQALAQITRKSLQELGSGSTSLMSVIELHSEPHLPAK